MISKESSRQSASPALWAGLLGLLLLGVYWPATTFNFVRWDDQKHLSENPLMHPPTLHHLGMFWAKPYFGLYVPVTYSVWSLVAMVARVQSGNGSYEFNPYLFHCLNILTHFVGALIVWRILFKLVPERTAAWFGAALFALHPTCVEPVAWVSGFRDLLGAALGFASLLCYLPCERKGRNGSLRYAMATLFFALAILSKPAAVAILPMAMALDLFWLKRRLRIIALRLFPWTVASIVLAWMTHRLQSVLPLLDTPPWWQRPLVAGDAISFYLEKLLLPIRLCVQYDHSPHRVLARGMGIMPTGVALMAVMLVFVLGWRWRWAWLSGGLFVGGLLPVLGFVPFGFQYFSTTADRYLYIALLGPAAAAAFILNRWPKRFLYYFTVALLGAFAILSFNQVRTWQSTQAIFSHALVINPNSNLALVMLSREKLMAGDPHAAEQLARRALAVRPDDVRAWVNLGAALEGLHEPRQARDCYLHVIATNFSAASAGAYSNLAAMQAERGDFAGAIALYQKALARDPDLPEAQIGMAAARRASELH